MIAYVGGLLGLFAGFSLLSIIELLYFLIIRPLFDVIYSNSQKIDESLNQSEQSELQTNENLLNGVFKYLERSSIKSFNYIADEKSKIAKFLWLALSVYIIYEIVATSSIFYEQVNSNSIAVDLSGNPVLIDKIKFPAVTIVSDLQYGQYFEEMTKEYESFKEAKLKGDFPNTTWIDIIKRKYLNLSIIAASLGCSWHGTNELNEIDFKFNDNSDVANYFLSLDYNFKWFNETYSTWNNNISPKYQKIFLKHGYAHTFNMINCHDLFNSTVVHDDFYKFKDYDEPTPWSPKSNGESMFTITMKRNQHLYESTTLKCQDNGFLIHNPYEIPASQNTNHVSFGAKTEISISVDVYEADKSLYSIPLEKRGCYLKNERKLFFFKIYTQNGCLKECLSFYTNDICGCVPHHYVRTKDMKVCDVKGLSCSADLTVTANHKRLDALYGPKGICNCLYTCDRVSYTFDARTTRYNENYDEK